VAERYDRKSLATTPDGRHVLVSTVAHALVKESAVFPVNDEGEVTSTMHLFRRKHGTEEDLDAAHDSIVAGVEDGTITLEAREPTPEEVEEAWGELILLDKMTDNRAMDDETNNA
jgi:hypothetical protein